MMISLIFLVILRAECNDERRKTRANMMKAESFNWQRTGKICSGIKDFGLLREKCTDDENKPNFSSIYFSRAVFTIGVIAGITFIVSYSSVLLSRITL